MIITSPTGLGIRNDPQGGGYYDAPRGSRRHKGIDFLCVPGQDITCPIEYGTIIRVAYPYSSDLSYKGLVIENDLITIRLYYCTLFETLLNKRVERHQPIAKAQNIASKYRPYPKDCEMKPHIHLGIDRCDPALFMV
jgi:hypothetical protein